MFSKLILKYINNLTKNDIMLLASSNNIKLNNDEVDIIYNYIKKDYKILLYGNSEPIFNDLKNKINYDSYEKIKYFFNFYKKKYKNYL